MLDAKTLAFASFAILTAGVIRGFSGFGFSIGAVPLLSLVLEPIQVIPVVLLLQLVAGLETAFRTWRLVDWRTLRWLLVGSVVGLLPGIALLTALSPNAMRLAISLIAAAAVVSLASGWRFRAMPGRGVIAAIGVLAGALNGAAAMPGPPVIALFLASRQPPSVCRASLVLFFLITGLAGAVAVTLRGLVDADGAILAATLIPALWAGSWLGERVFRLSGTRFYRPAALVFLAAIAATTLFQVLKTM